MASPIMMYARVRWVVEFLNRLVVEFLNTDWGLEVSVTQRLQVFRPIASYADSQTTSVIPAFHLGVQFLGPGKNHTMQKM